MSKRIEQEFEVYHNKNPHVYENFLKFTKQAYNSGRSNYSANGIFERMRWHTDIETVGTRFKLSNNFRPYYARKVMEENPQLSGFFRIKELKD